MNATLRSIRWTILGGALLAFMADGVLIAAPSRGSGGGGHGSARSFSSPSRSFSAPSRSFSAPSRSFSAPSRSFSSPSRSFSAPSRGGSSSVGSFRSLGRAPSVSAGPRSPIGPSSSFRSHPSPSSSSFRGYAGSSSSFRSHSVPGVSGSRGLAGASNSARFHASPGSSGSHSVARPSGSSYRPSWPGASSSVRSDPHPSGSRSAGRLPDAFRSDAHRDSAHRYDDKDRHAPSPYRYGNNDWNHHRDWYRGRDWWRPSYHHHYGNVVWPFWYHRWYTYYPRYWSSYYLGSYYDGYPYAGYYGYPGVDYYYGYADVGSYSAPIVGYYDGLNPLYYSAGYEPTAEAAAGDQEPVAPAAAAEPADAPSGSEAVGDVAAGQRFFADALTAFQRQDYRRAARMANHAMIEMPQDARVHELLSLSLFALGDYRGATMEAHAALAQGTLGDWARLYAYYQDQPTYAKHLGALEQYLKKNPSSLDARFLLGYHYLMLGHLKDAKEQLTPVVTKAPWDTVAAQLLKKAGGETAPPPPLPNAQPKPGSAPASGPVPKTPPAPTGPSVF